MTPAGAVAAIVYLLVILLWDLVVLGTCTYLVFWEDHSGWWYLLAVALCCNTTSDNMAKIGHGKRREA